MNFKVHLFNLLSTQLLVLLFACGSHNSPTISTVQPIPTKPISVPTAAPLKPYPVTIDVGDKSMSDGNVTLAWQFMHFGSLTTIVYSLSGLDSATPAETLSPQLTNEKREAIKLIRTDVLAKLDGVQIGQFTFDVVPPGTQELELTIQSKEMEKPIAMTLAKFQAESDEAFAGSIYAYDDFEQGLYRISPNGFGLVKGDRVAIRNSRKAQTDQDLENERATRAANAKNTTPTGDVSPTANPPTPDTAKLDLAGGKRVVQDATLLIQELKSGRTQYLYFVILEDGEVKAEVLD